ncbi:unnamed protein product [Brachionus calyciflorus]|uniref:Uncharacterized protein n=1 Tax=Brachionus calyciflorus TaxID=104777 RepID=A0A813ZYX7_9BILA|nr:unnamed protein product [Brachionus calyciflorus]
MLKIIIPLILIISVGSSEIERNVTIEASNSSNPIVNSNHNLTMMAKKESNLIINGSGLAEIKTTASSSTSSIILIVLAVVILVAGGVIGAFFVMKKRLFMWNLNGEKLENNDGGMNNESSQNGSINKVDGVMIETRTQQVNEIEENKQEVLENFPVTNLTQQNSTSVANVLNEIVSQVDQEKQPLNQ